MLRLAERRSRVDAVLLGLVLGLGWWQTPQVRPHRPPALAWLLWKQREIWRDVWLVLPVAVLGALPWLISNVEHDWWSFDVDSGETPYPTRLRGFFSATFPMALGLRIPYTSEWPLGQALSAAAYAGLLVLFAIGWWRRRSSATGLLFGVAAVFRFSTRSRRRPGSWTSPLCRGASSRGSLLVAQALTTVWRAAAAITAAAALSLLVLWHLTSSPAFLERADGLFVPTDFDPVIAELDRRGLEHVFASYWPAYRILFETDERIVAAEAHIPSVGIAAGRVVPRVPRTDDESRHRAYDTIVGADRAPATSAARCAGGSRGAAGARARRLCTLGGRRLRGLRAGDTAMSRAAELGKSLGRFACTRWGVLVLIAAVAGTALRVWVYRSSLGIPDSDEAVVG